MEETHEYANELGKQGGKNPGKIPKFSINHERSSRTIEKKSKITPTHSSDGILKVSYRLTDRQTDTDNYCNPRCACAPRVKNCLRHFSL